MREHVRHPTAAYHGRGLRTGDPRRQIGGNRVGLGAGHLDPPGYQAGSEKRATGSRS
jgi:hypothetical protein